MIFSTCLLATLLSSLPVFDAAKTIWFDAPAAIWEETVPLGDGRLGMMPDGGVVNEKIVLNEISMWSGSEFDYSNPEASKYLPEIRSLLLEGKNREAQQVMYEHFVPKKPEFVGTFGAYQMLADLDIVYSYPQKEIVPSDYYRGLELSTGMAFTTFTLPDGVKYSRDYYVPRDEDGMLIHIYASNPAQINFNLALSRPERGDVTSPSFGHLEISGELASGQKDVQGVRYSAGCGVNISGDKAKLEMIGDSIIKISNADEVWIGISAATSYFVGDEYKEVQRKFLSNILKDPRQAVISGQKNHAELMDRVELVLNTNENSYLPTPQRIKAFQQDDSDAALAALYYNLGRYLLISSVKPGYLPPNLQGLWANGVTTPWNGDYHTNINVQMNHWPLEPGNLPELINPLAQLTKRAVPSGERSAKAFYGDDAEGWVIHMMTNAWNYTEPGEDPSWGATNTGGAWLCEHIWDHYEFTGDKEFLAEYYPVMKGAAMFFLSTMITIPETGWLVTAPSSSPENEFYMPGDHSIPVSVCMGPTMDTQIVSELWNNVINASKILGIEDDDIPALEAALQKLPPMQIDSRGRLMEWLKEYEEVDPHHRHVSHLYGLYPGTSISPEKTPDLLEAAGKSLDARGDEGTGWSRAWKINFHARLLDGNRAWKVFKGLLQPAIDETTGHHRAGTFPNLFCSHPPFQIDGNFGGAAGISEMLVQSHDGYINLLPALPDALDKGELKGFRTRGGNEVDIVWENGLPQKAAIKGGYKENVKVKVPEGISSYTIVSSSSKGTDSTSAPIPYTDVIDLDVPSGTSVTLLFAQ